MTDLTRRGLLAAATATAAAVGGPALAGDAPALRTDQAELIRQTLAEAPTHGFKADAFGDLQALTTDTQLRRAILAYARAQHGARIPQDEFDKNWGLRPSYYNAPAAFDAALAQGRLQAWLDGLPPPFARYRTLRDGLATYRHLAAQGGWKPVPPGADLTLGGTGPRVHALRARLAFEDGAVARAPLTAPFDAALAASVKRFQMRHGVNPTGVVSGATLRMLNVTPARRACQIEANMERWRWVPRQLPADRIEVNIAAATLNLYADDASIMHMLAAAGRPTDESPMLMSTITSIVLNPPWNVPDSIAAKELFPKERKDPGYFEREGFVVRKPGEGVRLMQKPGPRNALGQVKFDFDNAYGVFLHDTSARSAFAHASRSVSHGCVRLEKPVDLAKRLLAPNGDWPPEKVDQTLAAADTVRAPLTKPMPLLLLYWTAYPEGAQLAFRDDVYGWDDAVLRLLDAASPA